MNDLQEWYKRIDDLGHTQLLPNKTFHLWVQAEDFNRIIPTIYIH